MQASKMTYFANCVLIVMFMLFAKGKSSALPSGNSASSGRQITYTGTCDGNCGDNDPAGNCYCDAICESLGDCCSDFRSFCPNVGTSSSSSSSFPGGNAVSSGPQITYTGTCDGNCGDDDPEGNCYCDAVCESLGDCCPDFSIFCPNIGTSSSSSSSFPGGNSVSSGGQITYTGTCDGNCGGPDPEGNCYCDDVCDSLGDCCPDFSSFCPNIGTSSSSSSSFPGGNQVSSGGPITYTGTCNGNCGDDDPLGNCYCDAVCESLGDCCPDFSIFCPNIGTSSSSSSSFPGGNSVSSGGQITYTGTCDGNCGGSDPEGNCYCDAICESLGDCCSDFRNFCPNVGVISSSQPVF